MSSPEILERTVYTDPVTRFVRSLPGSYYMLREAAFACDVSQFTLRRFIQDDVKECLPSKTTMFGKIRVYLYTKEDVERIQNYLANQVRVYDYTGPAKKMGRPATYSKDEMTVRKKLYTKRWYWTNRAKLLRDRGDVAGAQKAMDKADTIARELESK
jgi:hypothetical protein